MQVRNQDCVKEALKKCAVGLSASEVVEEYVVEDGELKLTKKKVTRRDIPPDLKAVKMLIEDGDVATADSEELLKEREELIRKLKENDCD